MATSRSDGVYSNNTRTPHCSTKRRPSFLIADLPKPMKTYGFRNSDLNVEGPTGDGLDLILPSGRSSLLACSKCAYTCPTMIYLTCGHTLCEACHLEPYQPYATMTVYVSRHTRAHCPFCREDVAYLPVAVRESFISQLRCFCPDCDESVSLRSIKKHLATCDLTLFERLSVDKPRDFAMCPPQSKEKEEEKGEEASTEQQKKAAASKSSVGDRPRNRWSNDNNDNNNNNNNLAKSNHVTRPEKSEVPLTLKAKKVSPAVSSSWDHFPTTRRVHWAPELR